MTPSRDISRLLDIMAMLRTPGSGCPWDLEQNFATIAPYTIEEAYEVADAIARGDLDDLRDELGDLLLQVVFHARMAEEQNAFSFGDVVEAITAKMIRRHPHVFADKDGRLTPSDVKGAWNCSARRQASGSTGTIRARCCTRFVRKLTRSKPRSIAATLTNSPRRPAISCSHWLIWRGMSALILIWRCAAPTPNSNAALATSSAHWPLVGVRLKARHSRRWTRCGMRRRPKSRVHPHPPRPKPVIADEPN